MRNSSIPASWTLRLPTGPLFRANGGVMYPCRPVTLAATLKPHGLVRRDLVDPVHVERPLGAGEDVRLVAPRLLEEDVGTVREPRQVGDGVGGIVESPVFGTDLPLPVVVGDVPPEAPAVGQPLGEAEGRPQVLAACGRRWCRRCRRSASGRPAGRSTGLSTVWPFGSVPLTVPPCTQSSRVATRVCPVASSTTRIRASGMSKTLR